MFDTMSSLYLISRSVSLFSKLVILMISNYVIEEEARETYGKYLMKLFFPKGIISNRNENIP